MSAYFSTWFNNNGPISSTQSSLPPQKTFSMCLAKEVWFLMKSNLVSAWPLEVIYTESPAQRVNCCYFISYNHIYHYASYFNRQLNWKFFDPKNLDLYVLMLAPKSWYVSHQACRCIPCGTVKLRSWWGCREWIKGLNQLQRNIRTSSPKHVLRLECKSAPTMGAYVLVTVKTSDVWGYDLIAGK